MDTPKTLHGEELITQGSIKGYSDNYLLQLEQDVREVIRKIKRSEWREVKIRTKELNIVLEEIKRRNLTK